VNGSGILCAGSSPPGAMSSTARLTTTPAPSSSVITLSRPGPGSVEPRSDRVRLYLDDLRDLPAGFDAVARTAEEAIELLRSGCVVFLSLDHDLGTEATGYTVACWIEQAAHAGTLLPLQWAVHSSNPVGRARIKAALRNADRFWNQSDLSRRTTSM